MDQDPEDQEDQEAREDELLALQSILGPQVRVRPADGTRSAAGELRVSVDLPGDFFIAAKEADIFVYFGISSLPPLSLCFRLPEEYPSRAAPASSLTCSWLTRTQICALEAQLAYLYQASGGAVVLFSWVQFLKADTLRFLDINSLLVLPSPENPPPSPDPSEAPQTPPAPRPGGHPPEPDGCTASNLVVVNPDAGGHATAPGLLCVSGPELDAHPCSSSSSSARPPSPPPPPPSRPSSQTLLSLLLVHDEAEKQRVFAESVVECGVCLAPAPGSGCMRFRDCGHAHCEPCLAQHCVVQISEGTVRGLTCPQPRCEATPTPAQVRKLVGDDLFDRYDRLLFQSSLDSMTDVVYCPRVLCASAVIVDPGGEVAQCAVCSFAFCVACRRSYHGTDRCPAAAAPHRRRQEPQDYADIPQSLVGMMALWEDYSGGSAQRRRLLEKRYGTRVLTQNLSEYLTEGWCLSNDTKNCPHCGATIQKNGGCNHMCCAMCQTNFLWDPYSS